MRSITFLLTATLTTLLWSADGMAQVESIPNPIPDQTPTSTESIQVADKEILVFGARELEPTPADPAEAPSSAAPEVRPAQAEQPTTAEPSIVPIPSESVETVSPQGGPIEDPAPFSIQPAEPEVIYDSLPRQRPQAPPTTENTVRSAATQAPPARTYRYSANGQLVESMPQSQTKARVMRSSPPSAQSGQVRVFQQVDAFGRRQRIVVVQDMNGARSVAPAARPVAYYQSVPSAYARATTYGSRTAYRPSGPLPVARPAAFIYGPGSGAAVIAIPVAAEPAPFVPGRPILNAIRSLRY